MNISRAFILLTLLCLSGSVQAQEPNSKIAGKFFPYVEKNEPRIALVLSGGGSRGISQIGVLEALEAAHIPIDMIVGTSMGSIIGGLYASGYSAKQLDSIALYQDWNQLLALSDAVSRSDLFLQQKQDEEQSFLVIRLNGFEPILPSALANGQRLTTLLTRLVLNAPYRVVNSFDDLKIPFRSVATDMVSGRRVVISSGDLAQAMRASSTVPVVFTPVRADSLQLVDGGLVSNIPVDVARTMGADIVVAVNTTSPLRSETNIETPWDALDQMTSIMMQLSTRLQLEKADVVITPNLGVHLASDFSDLDSLIYRGKIAAEAQIGKIDSLYRLAAHRIQQERGHPVRQPSVPGIAHLQTDDTLRRSPPYNANSLLLLSGVRFYGAYRLPDSVLIKPFDDLLGH
ncbi:MAG TPA: patatin-like phospholipase family protein, partial [Candidatus Kryptobacter bacterium]|nr:patatin-like phospholipase family protein [Candidatus Kryptobacter bacterium]